MNNAEMKNGPHFEMWVIGIAAGLVAGGVMYIVGQYGFMASAFVAALVALIVGAIFGMPKARVDALPEAAPEEHAAPVMAEAAPAAPVMAAFAAMPAAEPVVAQPAKAAAAPKPAKAPAAVKPAAAKPAVAKPAAAPKPAKPKKVDGPARLTGPRNGRADDLKEIEGIGPAMEKLVNGLGFYHFDQLSNWSDADVAWVDTNMASFKGRIMRDKWVAQAKIIVAEGLDAFRIRAKTNDY
jgi:predicted flap endonuclease-1-like 5' DNA nuclease